MPYSTINIFGYSVFCSSISSLDFNTKTLINTINQNAFVIAEHDKSFREALLGSDVLLPDGIGIVAAGAIFYGKRMRKIAGADLFLHVVEHLNDMNGRCFFLGSSHNTLDKIRSRLSKEYPNITAGFHSPSYTSEFSEGENSEMMRVVNTFRPDVLFVGMTAPKQEKWAFQHKIKLNAKLICSVGAVFDFYAGTIDRPGKVWINLGLEWFIRLIREPKRMWRRYLYNGPIFIYLLFKLKITKRKASNE